MQLAEGLTTAQESQVKAVIGEFRDTFTDLPETTSLVSHHVRLTTSAHIRRKPYSIPFAVRENLR